jgi:hypothetical protein
VAGRLYENYDIIENLGIRTGTLGRFSLGYVIGVRKGMNPVVLYRDNYTCALLMANRLLIFAYIPPCTNSKPFTDFLNKTKELTERFESHEIIIIGDLNSRIGSEQSTRWEYAKSRKSKDPVINSRGRTLLKFLRNTDLFVLNGCNQGDRAGELTYTNFNGASVIDLCIVNSVLEKRKIEFKVLNSSHSRHFPIELSIGSVTNQVKEDYKSVNRIIWDPSRYEEFCNIMDSLPTNENPKISDIIKDIYFAAEQCELIKTRTLDGGKRIRGPVWFDACCLAAKKEMRIALRSLRKAKGIQIASKLKNYIEAKRNYKVTEAASKQSFYNNLQDKLRDSKSSKDFYKALSIFRNRNSKATSTKVPIEVFHAFFQNVYSNDHELISNPTATQILTEVEELDKEFSMEELNICLKKLGKNKAPGQDGIPNEIWKSLPESTKIELLKVFNELFAHNNFPENWSEIIISPLYKKEDPNLPNNYRPISLVNTVLKLFTQIISNRLLSWSEKNKVISDYQAAFKRKSGCANHVFLLTTTLQYNLNKGRKVYGLFIDMSQAFDTVNHKRLWVKLQNMGVSSKIIKTLNSIYSTAKARVRTNYDISEVFPIEKGVLQGETVSPVLWNLYIEDLIHDLDNSETLPIKILNRSIHALLYADDIVLLAYTPFELQKKINVLSKYFAENSLKINLTKTKFIIFSKRKDNSKPRIVWRDEIIERVTKYTYLGVPISENLKFKDAKLHFTKKAEKALSEIKSLIYRSKMQNLDSILVIYYSLIRSVISYCAPIWGLKFGDYFEKTRSKFLKSVFLLPRLTPGWFVRLETDLRDSEIWYLKSCLKFWISVTETDKNSLVYCAYNSLKTLSAKPANSLNQNWYNHLKLLCRKWGCEEILRLEDDKELSSGSKYLRIVSIFKTIEQNSISADIASMNNTNLLALYKLNKTHCLKEPYLNDNHSWQIKQLILQLKLGVSHVTHKGKVAKLRSLEYWYQTSSDSKCPLCGKHEENIQHIMFVCPHYIIERTKFVFSIQNYNSSFCNPNCMEYLRIFNNLDAKNALKLSNFFNCALTRRKLYLSEMNVEL